MVWLLTSISYLHDFFVYFLMHFILQFTCTFSLQYCVERSCKTHVSMKVFNHFIFFSFLTRFLFALLSTIICFIPLKNWATINSTFAPWEWVRKIDITTFLFIDLCSNAKVELLLTELKAHLRKYFTPVIGNIVEQTKNIIHVTWIPAKT